MSEKRYISDIPVEAVLTWQKFREAFRLIREKKLWDGFWRYGWASSILLIIAALAGLGFLSDVIQLIGAIGTESEAGEAGTSFGERAEELLGSLFLTGSWKYVLLILGEVLVFHLLRRTIELVGGPDQDASFSAFLQAQKRMFVVALFSWVMEMVVTILISIAIGILGFHFLKTPLTFLVQAYFLGFAMTDNYFERYGLTIEQSHKKNLEVIGVSLGLGLILYFLFLIPLIGPLFGTAIGAVAAALTLYYLEKQKRIIVTEPIESESSKV